MGRSFSFAACVGLVLVGCQSQDRDSTPSTSINHVSSTSEQAEEGTLERLRDGKPLLVVASPSEVHPNYYDFDRQCLAEEEEARKRNLVIVELFRDGKSGRLRGGEALSAAECSAVHQLVSPPERRFSSVFIAADGKIARKSSDQPVALHDVLASIRPFEEATVAGSPTGG